MTDNLDPALLDKSSGAQETNDSSKSKQPQMAQLPSRPKTSNAPSQPSTGHLLTGKQEHYLKRELISQQVVFEISELASTTALQRFGAPFRSEYGEVAPVDSDLPLLRYIFVHHVRNFPFLDQAREKEFWQDKLQVFLESFASKHISSSEDRSEETKRRKLAIKAQKLVELMMVSGIPTASGYEERIRFSEMEVVDRGANEQGLLVNIPEGHFINGWDVNIAAVRTTSIKRTVRYHQHAEFILKVKQAGKPDIYVGRRYGDFTRLQRAMRTELPGKILPPLPRKNKSSTTSSLLGGKADSDASSVSSVSTQNTQLSVPEDNSSLRHLVGKNHARSLSVHSNTSARSSGEFSPKVTLYRESQRVSLRAFLRTFLQNKQIADSKTMTEFLTLSPIKLNAEELDDEKRRKEMDEKRIEEQKRFYEIARERARELDVYMERFRRDVVESNGLTKLFAEIKEKQTIADLSLEYQKFAEWLRIEVAATIYHLFLAEDNSPELLAQAKRIHSMIPYTTLKQVIRFANPAAVMSGVLDLFLAQPFGTRSLAQRVFGLAINDGIRTLQRTIDTLQQKINHPIFCQKLETFCNSDEEVKNELRDSAHAEDTDLIVAILRSERIPPELTSDQVGQVFNAYVAWNHTVEHVDDEMKSGALLFSQLKQLLKLYTRKRDKAQMLSVIQEPVTLHLFRDLFTIFYEPLVRVYKSANVYSSVTDFAAFADDTFSVLDTAQRQDVSADPNQTVQSFIDLCARHQDNFYKFVHEVHVHDNGLFTALMGWLEGILEFLRHGPKGGKLDMNALFQGAVDMKKIDKQKAIQEIDALIKWQEERKKWHQDKTRQKMATAGTPGLNGAAANGSPLPPGAGTFKTSDFGLHEQDVADLNESGSESGDGDSDVEDGGGGDDPIASERRRRARVVEKLKRTAGEPVKPEVKELEGLREGFLAMLRMVLAD
ncbi:uncharacterized protein KY384_004116 [Bacidia gigantensis]|uniref:uncharacterized protein n=1 Tax=Bacidia gigantensis TaxID=2732470 RepID=UPI001D058A60|nr:uncharacterized protein KY384_004116 [Bacidia gigantensis]KAG8530759.1 hypothetical protein KY384_004116 [Bacidia gigantensis]